MRLEDLPQKVKCCISGRSLEDSTINLIETDYKATWEYGAFTNVLYERKPAAAAIIHDDYCQFDETGNLIGYEGEIKWVVEFTDDDRGRPAVIYHDVADLEKIGAEAETFVLPNDTKFFTSPDAGKDCLCSRCGRPIWERAIRITPDDIGLNEEANYEYRYHMKCLGIKTVDNDSE